MDYKLLDNINDKQFEFHIDGQLVKIEYILTADKIFLTHTEVPTPLEGKGLGFLIIKKVLDNIKERELTLVPLCPFVALYIKRHPEWKDIVLKGVNIE